MSNHPHHPLLAALLLALPAAAFAQEAAPQVEPVVVAATRTPTPLSQVGSSITLITAADIEDHQWRTVPDALAEAPGLNVVQTGGPGGQTSVFIRGANANHTKVLIDGIEVNDPSQNDAFDFGQLQTAGIGAIEVLRGPQSSLYGSDAIGGVVNIITAPGKGPPRLTASLEGGSFATFNQGARVAGSSGRLSYSVDLAHFRAGDTPVTPLDLLPPGHARIGDANDNTTASAKLGADLSKALGLDLVVRYTNSDLRFTSDDFSVFPSVPAAAQTDQSEHQFFVRGQARADLLDGKFENVVGIAYSAYRTRLQSPDAPFGPQAPTFDRGDRLKVDWQGTIALAPGEALVLGAEDTISRLIDSPVDARRRDAAGWAEWQSNPAAGLHFAASARIDDDDRFGDKVTWRIAPSYTLAATGTRLKASVGTGFKSPTLTQLYVSFPEFDFFANPDLKPETSQGFDAGFEQPLAAGRLRFGATWFRNRIRELIDTNAAGDSFANVDRATTWGVESFIAAAPLRNLTLRADYTYTVARNDETAEELLRRPKQKVSASGVWRAAERLKVSTSLTYVGSWIDGNRSFSIPRLRASPYFVANIAADYAVGHGVTLFGRIDNLLDRRYQDPVGFQRPGIGAFAGVKVDLGGT